MVTCYVSRSQPAPNDPCGALASPRRRHALVVRRHAAGAPEAYQLVGFVAQFPGKMFPESQEIHR